MLKQTKQFPLKLSVKLQLKPVFRRFSFVHLPRGCCTHSLGYILLQMCFNMHFNTSLLGLLEESKVLQCSSLDVEYFCIVEHVFLIHQKSRVLSSCLQKSGLLSNGRKLLHEGYIKWMSARGKSCGKCSSFTPSSLKLSFCFSLNIRCSYYSKLSITRTPILRILS